MCKKFNYTFTDFEYNNNKSIINLSCFCGNEWKSTYSNFVNVNSGCPRCSGNVKITQIEAENKITEKCNENNYQFYEFSYENSMKTKIKFKCFCDREWTALYNDFINNNSGCPSCKGKISDVLYFFNIRDENNKIVAIKFGVSSRDYKTRLKDFEISLRKHNEIYNKNYSVHYSCHIKFSDNIARIIEGEIHNNTIKSGYGFYFKKDFYKTGLPYTETRSFDSFTSIITIVNLFLSKLHNENYNIHHAYGDECILWEKIF